ncbi:hypothetical protein ACVWWN_007746 [Mycobacterium sp. URHB0021]
MQICGCLCRATDVGTTVWPTAQSIAIDRKWGQEHAYTESSASVGENCGRHNLEVFHPPTSRRWAAVRVSTARASGKLRIPPIRGRAGELKVIGALIDALAQGRGGVLVIEGPPGIGKSRMLTEILALAEKAGVRALFGEAFEYQQTVPFFSLFMATLRADPPVGDVEALRRLGGSADLRYWVVHDLAYAIHAAAAQTPLVVVLEDIHWADSGTLLALRVAGHRPAGCGGVVGGDRAHRGGRGGGSGDVVGAATHECHIVAIGSDDAGRGRRHGLRRGAGEGGCVAAESGRQGARESVFSQRTGRWSWRGGSARVLRWACRGHRICAAAAAARRYAAATGPALR